MKSNIALQPNYLPEETHAASLWEGLNLAEPDLLGEEFSAKLHCPFGYENNNSILHLKCQGFPNLIRYVF
jgi:hypothetical protein